MNVQDIDRTPFVAVRCCVHLLPPPSLATKVASFKILYTLRTNDQPTDRPLKYGMFHKFENVPVFWRDVVQIFQKHRILVQNNIRNEWTRACDFVCLSDEMGEVQCTLALIYVFI